MARQRRTTEAPATAAGLLAVWVGVGLKSVGGGQAVQFYAFETLVTQRKWLTHAGWVQAWGLSQVVPGINVVALAGVVGLRLAGVAGAIASLAGLVLPSIVATVALAALYARIAHVPGVDAALHGMFIAVSATALIINWRVGRPLVMEAWSRRRALGVVTVLVPVVAGVLVYSGRVPVVLVLLGGAVLLAAGWVLSPSPPAEPPSP